MRIWHRSVRLAPTGTKRRMGYMKEMALFMDAKEEGREEGREEEKKNTEKERKRANAAEAKVKELEAKIAANQVV